MDYKLVAEQLTGWLKERVQKAGAKGLVVGLSGGIDSAVVGALCRRSFPEEHLGVIMPCESSAEDAHFAGLAAEALGLKTRTITLNEVYRSLIAALGITSAERLAAANIKPRLRMTTLYALAAQHQYLVAGTGNRSEWEVGYFTKYGDGGVDLEPIGNLVKTQVRELAEYLGVPREIIDRPPTAGLWQGQTDETEMGFTYEELDRFLLTGEASPEVKTKIERLKALSEHKRHLPPMPQI